MSGPPGITEALAEPAGLEQGGQSQKVLGAESLTLRLQTCVVSQCPPGRLQRLLETQQSWWVSRFEIRPVPSLSCLDVQVYSLQSGQGVPVGGGGLSPCVCH